jgi:glycosyltransferase involved in cell wall biosynthesis
MDSRITVTFVIASLAGGGAEKVLIHILRRLSRDKFRIRLFALAREGTYLKDIPEDVVFGYGIRLPEFFHRTDLPYWLKLVRLPFKRTLYSLQKMGIWRKFKRFCRDSDVVVGFLEQHSTYLAARAGRKLGKKSIGWIHIDLNQHLDGRNKRRSRKSYAAIDKVIACSGKAAKSAVQLYPELAGKLETIYNPIDLDEAASRAPEPVPDVDFDGIHVLAAGRLEKQKGFDYMIRAHRRLLDLGVPHRLIILGSGSQWQALQKLASELKVEDTVLMPGFVDNWYSWVARADAFALSSRYEGLCNVIIESLAVGTPVVSFDCPGGPSEILDGGEYGLLVEPGDVEGMALALKRLLESPSLREELAARGRKRAEAFSSRRIMPQIERAIEHLT